MKRFLTKFFSISFVFLVTYVFVLFIYEKAAPEQLKKNLLYNRHGGGHLYTRFKEAETVKDVDILVIGSSHAYRGFDPRIFKKENIDLFVLGSSAQSPIQTEYLIDKYIDQFNPKIVLYEVYYITLELDGAESAIDVFSNAPKLDRNLLNMALKINNVKAYNTLAYTYVAETLGNRDTTEPVKKELDTYVKGGYIERKMIKNEYRGEKFIPHDIDVNEKQLKAFKNICKKLNERNIKIVLVQAPIPVEHYQSISNRKTLDSLFHSIKDVNYYNYNEMGDKFKNEHFFDITHLNQSGVEKFDQLLLQTLKRNDELQVFNPDQPTPKNNYIKSPVPVKN